MTLDPLSGAALDARLRRLAEETDEPGRMTRLTLGRAHRRAADLVAQWMREAGLAVRMTGLGDVVGTRPGAGKTIVIGSHIDTVIDGGIFDGNLGVVAGIAVAEATRAQAFPLTIVAFADEEGVRFPNTLTGSRALAGAYDPSWLDAVDRDGTTRRAALDAFGVTPGWDAADTLDPASTVGFLELHIEQGPVLEARGHALGIVSAIAGASRGRVIVAGEAGHAGTLPMGMRRDALAAAAEMVIAVEETGRAGRNDDLVATVGRFAVAGGGAVNTVAGAVEFSLDVRAPENATRRAAVATIERRVTAVAAARGVSARVEISYDAPAAPCDPGLMAALTSAVAEAGHGRGALPSGAGHDAMAFRGRIPMAMLFARCQGGISHNPAEFCSPEDMEAAARVLCAAARHVARG